ncbi:MAG: hypothetical protein L6265_08975 [Thermoplasmatales archaeon]|nr:hypothetical protein [Thermoplasmatales archaeon]
MESLIRCDKEILFEFRKAVLNKYGKLYGMLKKEADAALSERTEKLKMEVCENVRGMQGEFES